MSKIVFLEIINVNIEEDCNRDNSDPWEVYCSAASMNYKCHQWEHGSIVLIKTGCEAVRLPSGILKTANMNTISSISGTLSIFSNKITAEHMPWLLCNCMDIKTENRNQKPVLDFPTPKNQFWIKTLTFAISNWKEIIPLLPAHGTSRFQTGSSSSH